MLNMPFSATLLLWFALTESALWRQVSLSTLAVVALVVVTWDFLLFRRRVSGRMRDIPLPRFVLLPTVGIMAFMLITGGIESPVVPTIPMVVFVVTYFGGPKLSKVVVFGCLLPTVAVATALTLFGTGPQFVPDLFGGGTRAGHTDALVWTTAVLVTISVLGVYALAEYMRSSLEEMLDRAASERDRALEMHAEHSRALTTLSGEIAHELKNPLASVKGLAALVALDLEGEPAEQMSVLRREVDRMQNVLEEFLNFSRPLVPLSQEPRDLVVLSREVAELHQGMAVERGISIGVQAERDVEVSCDDRKVRQVLMNLLQNALEASPTGGRVIMRVGEEDENEVSVRILDRGPGLSEDLRDDLFDPGVTDKPKGSGLGLTVARALARQHGGDLTVENRAGGGCEATLRLPREPVT